MISFKSFINAIHDAILFANDSLMEKHTGLLDKFFVDTTNEDQLQASLDEALRASNQVTAKKGNVTREDFARASEALERAKKALSGDNDSEKLSESSKVPGTLSPKSVVVEYPRHTENGIELIEIHVPLITLTPVTMTHIEKATLTANFEMQIIDGGLQLNFSDRSRGAFRKKSKSSTHGKLEITISPQESSEGLKQLIEGYENALKSQIPS
jgi:hypothetical protein